MRYQISIEDKAFIQAVEAYTFSVKGFNHRAHLRLAYIYLTEGDIEASNDKVRATLSGLLQHNNIDVASKYHETLSKAWLMLVSNKMGQEEELSSADDFIERNPGLLNSSAMLSYYSEDVLFSDQARRFYVEPNLKNISP